MQSLYTDEINPQVNTIHHQAIKELGKDLEVYASSPDGLIEAIGYKNEPQGKVMGVQWHPEFTPTLEQELIHADVLFDAFIKHARN